MSLLNFQHFEKSTPLIPTVTSKWSYIPILSNLFRSFLRVLVIQFLRNLANSKLEPFCFFWICNFFKNFSHAPAEMHYLTQRFWLTLTLILTKFQLIFFSHFFRKSSLILGQSPGVPRFWADKVLNPLFWRASAGVYTFCRAVLTS